MKQQLSPGAQVGILVVVLAIIGVIAWKVFSPGPLSRGPDMMHWDPNKVPTTVKAHLQEMQAHGGKMPPP